MKISDGKNLVSEWKLKVHMHHKEYLKFNRWVVCQIWSLNLKQMGHETLKVDEFWTEKFKGTLWK